MDRPVAVAHVADDGDGRGPDSVEAVERELDRAMGIVIGATDTLAGMLTGPPADQVMVSGLVGALQRQTRLARQLVGRLALLRAVEAGTFVPATEHLDLVCVVEDAVADMAPYVVPARAVELVHGGPVPATLDPVVVTGILFGLLRAIDRYSSSSALVSVAVERKRGVGRVVIRDPGHDDAPTDGEAAHRDLLAGPGLHPGLRMARTLARAHGGDLLARRMVDGGVQCNEFVVVLPVKQR